jgi:hypothetical protein
MKTDWHDMIQRYIAGTLDESETWALQEAMKEDENLRTLFLDHINLDAALDVHASARQANPSLLRPIPVTPAKATFRWYAWRPLTAAAVSGMAIGMFCTSMVFGFVALRPSFQTLPLPVFDPGFEGSKPLDTGLPHRPKEWGVRSAQLAKAERGVQPLQGSGMLRMEPVLRNEEDDYLSSGAFQVLDLTQMPTDMTAGEIEAEVSAKFTASNDEKARYIMRVVALDESPESATRDFWSKADKAEVVSMTQRFDAASAADGWQPHFVRIPVPSTARSLMIVISVLVPRHQSPPPSPHYLDDIQASLILRKNHHTE